MYQWSAVACLLVWFVGNRRYLTETCPFFAKFQINTCKILINALSPVLILAKLKVTGFGNSCKWSRKFSKRYSNPDVLIHSPLGSKEFCQSESELSLVMSLFLTSSKLNYLRQHKHSFLTSPQ